MPLDYALVVFIIHAFPFLLLLFPLSLPFFPFVQRVVYEITNTKWDLTGKGLDPKNQISTLIKWAIMKLDTWKFPAKVSVGLDIRCPLDELPEYGRPQFMKWSVGIGRSGIMLDETGWLCFSIASPVDLYRQLCLTNIIIVILLLMKRTILSISSSITLEKQNPNLDS